MLNSIKMCSKWIFFAIFAPNYENNFSYMQLFRITTTWLRENPESGAAEKTKTDELVEAANFTEAETVGFNIAERENRHLLSDVDINIKRIDNVSRIIHQDVLVTDEELLSGFIYNYFEGSEDSGEGLYNVKVVFTEINEKGKEKKYAEIFLVPASSNGEATKVVADWVKKYDSRDAVVRDAKFDKASAILLTPKTYGSITKD